MAFGPSLIWWGYIKIEMKNNPFLHLLFFVRDLNYVALSFPLQVHAFFMSLWSFLEHKKKYVRTEMEKGTNFSQLRYFFSTRFSRSLPFFVQILLILLILLLITILPIPNHHSHF